MSRINKHLPADEIFARVRDLNGTIDEKAQLLNQFDRKDIRWLVDFAYNGGVVPGTFSLPEYKVSNRPHGIDYLTLMSALPQLNAALRYKDNAKVFNKNMAIVLENISAGEAKLLCDLFAGKKIEGVSKAVLKRVYPTFFRQLDTEPV